MPLSNASPAAPPGLRMGEPLAMPAPASGRVISRKQMERVLRYIDIGRSQGANIAFGGEQSGRPRILRAADDPDRRDAIHDGREGRDLRTGACRSSASPTKTKPSHSLTVPTTVWRPPSGRRTSIARIASRIGSNAGTVWINTYGPTDTRLPWGGMGGESGIGRDLGRSAIDNYTEQKTVWLQYRAIATA